MKKKYSSPAILIVKIRSIQTLLQASFSETLGSSNRGGGEALSRSSDSFWDDDDDYEE